MILLACCWLSYRFIEAPMQRQGRKFAAWLEYWFGPDSIPAHFQAQESSRSADEAPAAAARRGRSRRGRSRRGRQPRTPRRGRLRRGRPAAYAAAAYAADASGTREGTMAR